MPFNRGVVDASHGADQKSASGSLGLLHLFFLFPIKEQDMIDTKVLESFPVGSNPFHYDAISVGMTLEQIGLPDVYVMDSGRLGAGLYIYNKETGQRAKLLNFEPFPKKE
jgi:hypothetical protein